MALKSYTLKKHWLLADVSFFNCATHLSHFWGESNSVTVILWAWLTFENLFLLLETLVYIQHMPAGLFFFCLLSYTPYPNNLSCTHHSVVVFCFFLPTELSPTRTSADTVTLVSGCDFSICIPNNIAMQVKVCNAGQGDNF